MADMKFDIVALDRASSTFVRMAEQVDRLAQRIDKLDRAKANPKVEVDTNDAEREVGSFATEMRRQLEAAARALPELEIDANSTPAQRKLAELRARMQELADKKIGVDIDATSAIAQAQLLQRELDHLGRTSKDVQLRADTAGASAQLAAISGQVDRLDGRKATVKVDVDKSLPDAINSIARLGGSLRTLSLPASLVAAAPQIASIGSAAVSASGALLLMPAAAAAAGIAAGTLAVGLAHVADALGPTGTAAQVKKVNEAMAALPPNVRAAVKEIRGLGPAWSGVRMEVQQQLWDGSAKIIDRLGHRYLPVAKVGLAGVADELNNGATQLAKWADSDAVMLDLAGIIGKVKQSLHEAAPAGTNLAAALTDMGVVGSTRLPALAGGLTNATGRFREFIAEARKSGQLGEWIDTGIAKVEQLGHIAGNTGGILVSVFDAADQSGADFLGTVEQLTGRVNDFFNSAEGEQALLDFFTNVGQSVDNLQPGLDALGRALVTGIGILGPLLPEAATGLSKVAESAAPLVVSAAELARTILGPLISGFTTLAPVLVPVAAGLLGIGVAIKGFAAYDKALTTMVTNVDRLGKRAADTATMISGSAAAGERVATSASKLSSAMGKVGNSLPFVGAGLVALGIGYDMVRSKADSLAGSVVTGSMKMKDAVAEEKGQLDNRNLAINTGVQVLTSMAGISQVGAIASDLFTRSQSSGATASANINAELNKQLDAMTPLERANFYVTQAQDRLTEAVDRYSPSSQQARDAQSALTFAVDGQTFAQQRNADQLQSTTDKLIANTNAVAGAANADLGLEQAVLRTKQAREQATEVLKTHTTSSLEGQQAVLGLQQANLAEAAAAQRKAEADAVAKGATDSAAQGARAYADRLIELASQATGPTRTALLGYIANLDSTKSGANDSALASRGLTDDISKIPGYHDTQFRTPGLDAARDGIKGITQEILKIQGKDIPIFVSPLGKGGIASAARLATGGYVRGPGTTTSDGINARLSDKEYVVRAAATQSLGVGTLDYINRTGQLPAFAKGGIVAQANGTSPVNLNFQFDRQGVEFGYPMPAGGVGGAGGTQRWAPLVLQALAMMGQPASFLGITLRRMNQESGGNQFAINNWDSNAMRGTPSKGLMQTIEPTFRAYHDPRTSWDIWNPLSNVLASMRYALARYGSLPAAYNKAGGYANGGVIDRPTFGLIGEAGPEAIIPLSRPSRAAEVMKQAGLAPKGGGVTINHMTVTITKEADVDKVVDRLNYLMAS